jgi:F-type H+-transporting ATPase subunit b
MPAALLAASGIIEVVPGLMIWTLIVFGITFYVLKRIAFGPIQQAIDKRRDRIREALDAADQARIASEELVAQQREALSAARVQAEEMLTDARRVADDQQRRLREELDAERQRRIEETRRDVEAETARGHREGGGKGVDGGRPAPPHRGGHRRARLLGAREGARLN